MKVNDFLILAVSAGGCVVGVNDAFCGMPPATPQPIVINLTPAPTPTPDQAAADAAKAAADAAALVAANPPQPSANPNQAAIDAAAKAAADAAVQQQAADAAAKAAAEATQKAVSDAAAAISTAQQSLAGMTSDAKVVSVLKDKAIAAASKADAIPQATAAQDIAKKVTDAINVIQNSFNTINASVAVAPGNSDVTQAVNGITQIKTTADGIVTAVNADVASAQNAVSTKL